MAITKVSRGLLSTGIVDNSNATAITIDSSERVGLGTDSPNAILTTDPESGNFSSTYNNYDGVGLFIRGNGTSGNGNYGPALAFGSCDSDTTNQTEKHAAISIVQTGTDPNETGLAFWTHPTTTAADALSEAMRIDSAKNLLVGQTTASSGTVGTSLRADGRTFFCADDNYTAHFNRKTSDGDIVHFAKDDTVVGSIGNISNDIFIYSSAANHTGLRLGDGYYIPTNNSGAVSDNTVDIGLSSFRYKDIYLSGGAFIGGTGSANKLDDYEEGNFTPTLSFGGGTTGIGYSFQEGRYIKIGKLVHIQILIALSSKGSSTGDAKITVPFAIDNISGSTQWEAPASFFLLVGNSNLGNSIAVFSDTQAGIVWAETQATSTEATDSIFTNTTNFRITGQYQTSA